MVESIAQQFNAGGPFMWVILIVLAVACAVVLERAAFYFVICRGSTSRLASRLASALGNGNHQEAARLVADRRTPLHVLLRTAVERDAAGMSAAQIQEGVEEAAIRELPRYGERLNYLALFANVATLLGLLGTIAGLQVSFSSLASVEAAQKATMLAKGISQAMNTTAFGLIVAVPCMVFYTILNNKQQRLTKELDEAVVKTVNLIKNRRS